jgi:hypothetical protein
MADWRNWRLKTIRDRIERARKEGDLPSDVKPDTFSPVPVGHHGWAGCSGCQRVHIAGTKRTIAMFRQTMPIPMN